MQVPKHWSSPRGRGRRGWAIRYISVLIAAVLLLNFAGLRLFDTHPSVLTGSHPYHFPLYWEHISTIDRSITPFERSIMLVWREKHEADNVFNYKLGSEKEPLECREVGDRLGMIAQAALGRSGKRNMNRTQITSVKAEITPGSFTFRKAYGREVLGTFQGGQEDVLHMQSYPEGEKLGAIKSIQPSLNLLIVNTNPFGAFHTLLVPRWGEDLPQELTLYALHLGIQYSAQCSGYQKLVFNSIGAGASINNLHWQAFHMAKPLPIENARTIALPHQHRKQFGIAEVEGWPIKAYAVTASDKEVLGIVAFGIVKELSERNIAHNLLVVDGARTVYIVPRTIGWFPDTSKKQIAAMEVMGFFVIPNREEYTSLDAHEAHTFLQRAKLAEDIPVTDIAESAYNDVYRSASSFSAPKRNR